MSSSLVEDWSEGDFDLDHTALRTEHLSLHDDHDDNPTAAHADDFSDWDHDEDQDASDEQTDTIKLSNIAGSALKQMLEASKASASSLPSADLHALDQHQLVHHDADLARLDIMRFANSHDDLNTCSTASLSTSASTSYRSMMGLSTDLTDPDSPHSKHGTRNTTTTTTTTSCSSSDRARSDLGFHSSEPDDAIDELDFELAPNMDNLSLCSSLSRARSNTSLSHVSRDLWDEEPALGASATPHQPATSSKSISGESDADDEHEDLLDGLDLQGSIFEPQPNPAVQPAPLLKAKLEAMLDLKRSGRHPDPYQTSAHVADSDSGIAAGLVITDDVDLSPSRITSRGLSNTRPNPSYAQIANSRLSAQTMTSDGHDERQLDSHASSLHQHQHQHNRAPTGEAPSQQSKGFRTEPRGPRRSLRFKRSTSDLQTHMSASSANPGPSASHRSQNRGSQLTRKRSLPSMRTSPPAPSSVNVAAVQLGAHTIAVRQRHNSGASASSSVSRIRSHGSSRLTDSTAASRARAAETAADQLARLHRDAKAPARPSTPVSIPTRSSHNPPPRISVSTRSKTRAERQGLSGESQPAARLLKRSAPYASGAELDGIDDLTTSTSPSVKPIPLPPSSTPANAGRGATKTDQGASQSQRGGKSKRGGRRHPKSKPGLIRSLGVGGSPTQKTVKGMRWNAQALRWEGNEAVLRDFDQVIQSSTRPALISQITGSSTSSRLTHAAGYTSPISPESSTLMNSIASGARVVGDMLFDPVQMRWVHKSGNEEDDVFAQFDEALDEGDASHDAAGLGVDAEGDNTLRARRARSIEAFSQSSNPWTRLSAREPAATASDDEAYERSLNRKHDQAIRRALSRGAFAASVGIERDIWDACVEADKRHALEVGGWLTPSAPYRSRMRTRSHTSDRAMTLDEIDRPRPHLYYLEKIAKSIARSDAS